MIQPVDSTTSISNNQFILFASYSGRKETPNSLLWFRIRLFQHQFTSTSNTQKQHSILHTDTEPPPSTVSRHRTYVDFPSKCLLYAPSAWDFSSLLSFNSRPPHQLQLRIVISQEMHLLFLPAVVSIPIPIPSTFSFYTPQFPLNSIFFPHSNLTQLHFTYISPKLPNPITNPSPRPNRTPRHNPRSEIRRHRPGHPKLHLRNLHLPGRRNRRNSNPLRRHLAGLHVHQSPTRHPTHRSQHAPPEIQRLHKHRQQQPQAFGKPLLRRSRNTSVRPHDREEESLCC